MSEDLYANNLDTSVQHLNIKLKVKIQSELYSNIQKYKIKNLYDNIIDNGRQHYDFIEHFHKSIEGFKDALKMDQQKREYLILNGIKLIEIPYNKMVQSKEELLKLIHETDYPSFEFKPLPEESESQIDFKAKQKEIRKGKYQQSKSFYKEDADKKKQRLEKERQARKERYKKMKENK